MRCSKIIVRRFEDNREVKSYNTVHFVSDAYLPWVTERLKELEGYNYMVRSLQFHLYLVIGLIMTPVPYHSEMLMENLQKCRISFRGATSVIE
jgi:hypothetical protein